jgi:hypothetical protein
MPQEKLLSREYQLQEAIRNISMNKHSNSEVYKPQGEPVPGSWVHMRAPKTYLGITPLPETDFVPVGPFPPRMTADSPNECVWQCT